MSIPQHIQDLKEYAKNTELSAVNRLDVYGAPFTGRNRSTVCGYMFRFIDGRQFTVTTSEFNKYLLEFRFKLNLVRQ